jgi:hypothetical protein
MEKQTLEKIESLKKEYPVIEHALHMECHGTQDAVPDIYIRVERMDSNLLYFIGQEYDGERAALVSNDDLRGSKYDRVLFFDKEAESIGGFTWGRGNKSRVKDWFACRTISEQDRLGFITKATVIHWHKENKEKITDENCRSYSYRAELVRKEIYLTLYLPPKKGIRDLLNQTNLMTNVRVSTDDITKGILNKEQEFEILSEELDAIAKKFMFSVFVRGLDKVIIKCPQRGMSGKFGDVTLRSWHMCGSIMMTFTRGDSQITLQGSDDDDPGIYFKSIDATLPDAKSIVDVVIAEWKKLKTPKEMKSLYKADDGTSYCGITNPK